VSYYRLFPSASACVPPSTPHRERRGFPSRCTVPPFSFSASEGPWFPDSGVLPPPRPVVLGPRVSRVGPFAWTTPSCYDYLARIPPPPRAAASRVAANFVAPPPLFVEKSLFSVHFVCLSSDTFLFLRPVGRFRELPRSPRLPLSPTSSPPSLFLFDLTPRALGRTGLPHYPPVIPSRSPSFRGPPAPDP